MTAKDKDKAKEISLKLFGNGHFTHNAISQRKEIEKSLLEMAKWKDEEFQEEKKKWLDKACMWIENKYIKNSGGYYSMYRKENIIKSFKQAMEE
jgi:hypothetical protein